MPATRNYKDGKFRNLLPGPSPFGRKGMWRTAWEFACDRSAVREPTAPVPVVKRKRADFDRSPTSGLRVTWLGHSTVLIEIDGRRVLTDPVWSMRASPLNFGGPKRFFAPPLPLVELPRLDAVVISHDHYDHLDKRTIKALHPKVPLFLVPLKVGRILLGWGVPKAKIRELDWWQEANFKGLRFVCAPARHFSGRSLFDSRTTLWSSWAILGARHRAFFSGDGGMSPSFAKIGRRLGPFDVTLMEVGAYHPRWADIHSGPEQAVQAHLDLKGRAMVPIHWGTFNLALHAWTEPVERLLVAASSRGASISIPKPGESVVPGTAPPPRRWWPKLPWKSARELPVVSPGLRPVNRSRTIPGKGAAVNRKAGRRTATAGGSR